MADPISVSFSSAVELDLSQDQPAVNPDLPDQKLLIGSRFQLKSDYLISGRYREVSGR